MPVGPARVEARASLGGGMVRDQQRALLDGAFYDGLNVLVDVTGKVRKRGGTAPVLGVSAQSFPDWLLAYTSSRLDASRVVYGVASRRGYAPDDGRIYSLAGGTLYAAELTPLYGFDFSPTFGKPFQHGDHAIFPWLQHSDAQTGGAAGVALAGSTLNVGFTSSTLAGTTSTTAGSPIVTFNTAADVSNFARPGRYINLDGNQGWFRIDRLLSATTVLVSPTPTTTASSATLIQDAPLGSAPSETYCVGAACGTSFQNRIVLGDCQAYDGAGSTGYSQIPFRVWWSNLPTESTNGGFQQILPYGLRALNFLDVPEARRIVALVPIGPSELLILAPDRALRLAGTLATISDANQSLPVDVQPISTTVGVLSDRSVQETPYGAVWADREGVYVYNGRQLTNAMEQTLQGYWGELQRRDGFQIYGSAFIGESHYLLSTSEANLLLDLRSNGWTRVRDDLSIASATRDPADPTKVYACKWFDPTLSVAPSATRDQVFRLDSLLSTTPTTSADHDGLAVEAYLETGAFPMGDPSRLKRARRVIATTDLKVPTNLLGLNADAEAEVYLPNADAEYGSVDWWRSVGSATLPTMTAATDQVHSGAYSIKAVTVAVTGADDGVRYDFPAGYSDGATIYSVEVWVRTSTAGTVSLTVGSNTDTTTTTGSWVRLVARNIPTVGVVTGLAAVITHSANSATFWVDDLKVAVLQPWQESGVQLTAGSVVSRTTVDKHGGDASIQVVCSATGQGVNYNSRLTLYKNVTYSATIWAKSISGNTAGALVIGDAGNTGSRSITLTTAWKKFDVSITPTVDITAPVVALFISGAGTFLVDDLAVTGADPTLSIGMVGGLEAEGDYGDGTVRDDFSTDYVTAAATQRQWDIVSGAAADFTITGEQLTVTTTPTNVKRLKHTGSRVQWRDGRLQVHYQTPDTGTIGDFIISLGARWTTAGCLRVSVNQSSIFLVKTVEPGFATTTYQTGTLGTALALTQEGWVVFELAGSELYGEHWLSDPDLGGTPNGTVKGYLPAADAAFDVAGDHGVAWWTSLAATAWIDDYRADPWDNVARVVADASGPEAARGDSFAQTPAVTLKYRSTGYAAECELGPVDVAFNDLRRSRVA